MKRAILSLLLLAAVGCGDNRADAPTQLAGGWNYTMELDDGSTVHGAMNLAQEGARVDGAIDLPIDAQVDAATWRWEVSGWVDGDTAALHAAPHWDCACDTVPVDWTCAVSQGRLDCGTFSAAFAGR